MPFYAVRNGKCPGIYSTWGECYYQVNAYKGAIYKKFDTYQEANDFLTPILIVPDYYVYTDGSCINNGKPNASAGIGIYFGPNDPRNISRKMEGKQTNNVAELTAILELYPLIEKDISKNICIVTDSEYSIRCVTTYGEKCQKDNWSKPIPNKELVKQIYELYSPLKNIQFMHIDAHTKNMDIHSIGNRNADLLARNASENP